MGFLFKIVLAFGIGAGAMVGLQSMWLSQIKNYVLSDYGRRGLPEMKPVVTRFEGVKITTPIFTPMAPIDTRAAQRAAINAMGHQIYLQNRAAANAVPIIRPIPVPGMRR